MCVCREGWVTGRRQAAKGLIPGSSAGKDLAVVCKAVQGWSALLRDPGALHLWEWGWDLDY